MNALAGSLLPNLRAVFILGLHVPSRTVVTSVATASIGGVRVAEPSSPFSSPFADPLAPLFTVGQVAELVGVQPAFLRRLDQQDVVSPARSRGRQRRYSPRQVDQVVAACSLIGEGITLAGVRRVFELQAQVDALHAELATLRAGNGPDAR